MTRRFQCYFCLLAMAVSGADYGYDASATPLLCSRRFHMQWLPRLRHWRSAGGTYGAAEVVTLSEWCAQNASLPLAAGARMEECPQGLAALVGLCFESVSAASSSRESGGEALSFLTALLEEGRSALDRWGKLARGSLNYEAMPKVTRPEVSAAEVAANLDAWEADPKSFRWFRLPLPQVRPSRSGAFGASSPSLALSKDFVDLERLARKYSAPPAADHQRWALTAQSCTGGDANCDNHCYTPAYAEELAPLRKKSALRVVQIGVCLGQSLAMWAEFFPLATVQGIDINPSAMHLPMLAAQGLSDLDLKRISVLEADATIPNVLEHLRDQPLADLIIDDASHKPQ
ncbi:unnamed protein product, partial [Polarella glacialis]